MSVAGARKYLSLLLVPEKSLWTASGGVKAPMGSRYTRTHACINALRNIATKLTCESAVMASCQLSLLHSTCPVEAVEAMRAARFITLPR